MRALLTLLLASALLAGGCTGEEPAGDRVSTPAAAPPGPTVLDTTAEATLQPDDLVDLTLYFRVGEDASAHLTPVVREVPVTDDLPLQALEQLLAGPLESEGGNVHAPLPTTTTVNVLTVEGGTAHADLSGAVLSDAETVGVSPANEVLGLAAVVNTLTEFPSIERVKLTVDGRADDEVAGFWGGWGLPDVLVRDESLIGPPAADGEGVAELVRFSTESQQVGSADAGAVELAGVRVRDRLTHTRFTVEVVHPEGPDTMVKVPSARARVAGAEVLLIVTGVTSPPEVLEGLRLEVDPEIFTTTTVEHDAATSTLRLAIVPAGPHEYRLHTLANPTRIVLDVKK